METLGHYGKMLLPLVPLGSPQPPIQTTGGILLSLHKSRWVPPTPALMALWYIVHQYAQKLYTPVDTTCKANEFAQSIKLHYPLPPPSQRQGPLTLGCSIQSLTPVVSGQKSLHQTQEERHFQPLFYVWGIVGCFQLAWWPTWLVGS